MSNNERQRKFQRAHPGYDRRRKSRERAAEKQGAARLHAQYLEDLKAKLEAEAAAMAENAPPAPPAPPAPVQLLDAA